MIECAPEMSILAILPSRDDQEALNEIFSQSPWNIYFGEKLRHARLLLKELGVGVVISAYYLPDGDWTGVLQELWHSRSEPLLIVASRITNAILHAEILNRGGCDLLATPFKARQVIEAVSRAWESWRRRPGIKAGWSQLAVC